MQGAAGDIEEEQWGAVGQEIVWRVLHADKAEARVVEEIIQGKNVE